MLGSRADSQARLGCTVASRAELAVCDYFQDSGSLGTYTFLGQSPVQ